MSLRTTALATADTPLPSACHCEPPLATAETLLSSACHCEPPPLQPLTRHRLLHVIANHPLQPLKPICLLHVIANQCAHWCGNPRPLAETPCIAAVHGCAHTYQACHCEPVRTLVWQSASPGRNAVHCGRARVCAYLPSLSLRTSAHTGVAIRVPWQKRRALRPCTGVRIPTKLVIANQCAHWCGNPFSLQ